MQTQEDTGKKPYLSLVTPVFNEKDCLVELYGQVKKVLKELNRTYEIIFVDDGSQDGSFALMKELAEKDPAVRVVRFSRNFGQTAAMAAGIDCARGEVIVTIDADLQNEPEDIPLLLDHFEKGADVVSGWRKDRHDEFLRRKLPSLIANRLVSKFGGLKLHDYGCTLKAYRAKNIKRIALYGEMHRFLPALVVREGGNVVEVPVRHHPRTLGQSKYGLERVFKVFLDLFLLKFISGYATRPIHFFGFFAFLLFGLGTIAGGVTFYNRYILGLPGVNLLPLVMLTMFLLTAGGQTILIGLLGEIGIRTYYESQQKKPYVIDEIVGEENR
ncbi:glycosyltransferase family 2 protein [Candidatus Bathyarchaeota archaeon]|nr:glycosyltransferase family 2 protein [Candidatus Bathyarchaeota archaeon]